MSVCITESIILASTNFSLVYDHNEIYIFRPALNTNFLHCKDNIDQGSMKF